MYPGMEHETAEYAGERTAIHLLTVAEVADRLGLHHKTVRRLIHAGELPGIKLGRGIKSPLRVPADELSRWLYANPKKEGPS